VRGGWKLADRYRFSYLAGGFLPVWTKSFEFESEAYAIQAARGLMRGEAEATTTRPITMLIGVGEDEDATRWIGSWKWAPNEQWGF
jgi:hypothetical protein